ncbi:MAG: hypothetical protein V9G09_13240 [Candidatus Nanopelagicales bacterium]
MYDAAERLRGYLEVAEGTEKVRWVFLTGGPEDGFDDLLRVARNPVGYVPPGDGRGTAAASPAVLGWRRTGRSTRSPPPTRF